MTGVTLPNSTAITYAYDGENRRVWQSVDGAITNYLWDETSPYGDVIYEFEDEGDPIASYVLAGTELISQKRGANTHFYLKDGQGSTRTLVNASGSILNTYGYHAFGDFYAPQTAGTTPNNYLYTGQQYDSLTGNYSLRARHYDPSVGRFLSQDKYKYDFRNPIELNRYVYTANNSVNYADPSGYSLIEISHLKVQVQAAAGNVVRKFAIGGAMGVVGAIIGGVIGGAIVALYKTAIDDLTGKAVSTQQMLNYFVGTFDFANILSNIVGGFITALLRLFLKISISVKIKNCRD